MGGGCRRNKRTKGSNSKSPASSGDCQSTPSASTSAALALPSSGTTTANILGLTSQFPQLRFMAPLGHLTGEYGEVGLNYGAGSGGISAPVGPTTEMNFQNLFGSSGGGGGSSGGGGGIEPWRLQQFPFMGALDPVGSGAGIYQFQGGGGEPSSSMINSQIGSVKMEENSNLSRQFLGVNINQGSDQWRSTSGNINAWTDISGFSSSSTSNPL